MLAPDLEQLQRDLAADPRVRQAIVFGSVAAGRARADSDLDLAVDLGRPLAAEDHRSLVARLATLSGRPVDLVDLRTVGEPLLGQILRHGRRLLGSHADFGRLIARHFSDSADFLPLRQRILAERRRAWIGT